MAGKTYYEFWIFIKRLFRNPMTDCVCPNELIHWSEKPGAVTRDYFRLMLAFSLPRIIKNIQ